MSDYRKFDAALQSAGVCYKTDEPMSAHTSFKIGGPADRFVEVKTVSELQAVLNAVSDENVPYFILGNGSNLLVPDEGLRGAVLTLLGKMEAEDADTCTILAGEGYSDEDLEALVVKIEEAYDELEVDAQRGEQPLYPIVFSVE